MGGLVLETFELCLKIIVMETWGVASTFTGLYNTPYSRVGELMGWLLSVQV